MTTLIVDSNLISNRVFFSPQGILSTKDGTPSGVIFGVLKSLQKYLQTFPEVTKLVMVWDGGKSEFRKSIYPEYKAQRGKDRTPEEQESYEKIFPQMEELHQFMPNLGVHSLKVKHLEGDDLAYICTELISGPKICVTSDKDWLQLISKDTSVFLTGKDVVVGLNDFKEHTGVSPEAYLGYRALVGDTSDNITGISGIGEGRAKKLMDEFGHIDNVLNSTGEARKKLEKSKIFSKIFTPEGKQILGRNHKIMNLKYIEYDEHKEYILNILNQELSVNSKAVRGFLTRYQFVEILSNYLSFINAFNMLGEE